MKISEYSEPDIGGKGEINMNKRKVIYAEAPKSISKEIAEGEVIADFLPPPEELVRKEPKVKITITLNSGNVDFFKEFARKNNTKYQTMINEILDKYVQKYKNKITV
jgi:predicted DNA binding CopG/RHH family protein